MNKLLKLTRPSISELVNVYEKNKPKSLLIYGDDFGFSQKIIQNFAKICNFEVCNLLSYKDFSSLYSLVKNKNFFDKKFLIKVFDLTHLSSEIKKLVLNLAEDNNFVCFIQKSDLAKKDIDFFIQHKSLLAIESTYISKLDLKIKIENFLKSHKLIYKKSCLDFLLNYFNNRDSFFIRYNLEKLSYCTTPGLELKLHFVENLFINEFQFRIDKVFFSDIGNLSEYIQDIKNIDKMIVVKYFIKNYYLLYLILLYKSCSKNNSLTSFIKNFRTKIYPSHFIKLLNISNKYSFNQVSKILSTLNRVELKIKKNKYPVNIFMDLFLAINKIIHMQP